MSVNQLKKNNNCKLSCLQFRLLECRLNRSREVENKLPSGSTPDHGSQNCTSGSKGNSADIHSSYYVYEKGSMLIWLHHKHTDLRGTGNSTFVKFHHRTNSCVYHRNEMRWAMARNLNRKDTIRKQLGQIQHWSRIMVTTNSREKSTDFWQFNHPPKHIDNCCP